MSRGKIWSAQLEMLYIGIKMGVSNVFIDSKTTRAILIKNIVSTYAKMSKIQILKNIFGPYDFINVCT